MNKQTEEFDHYFLDYHKSYIYQEKSFSCSINHNGIIAAAFKGSGLYLFDQESESFTPVQIDGYNSNPAITALFFDERNYLWLQEQSDKLLRIEITQDHQAKLIQEIILPEKVENIFYDQNKYIWFTQDTQLHYINVYDIKPKINPTDIKIEGTLNTVYSHNNQIFIGTTNGCFVFSNNRLVRYLDTARRIFCVADERGELLTAGHTVHCDVYTRCTKAQAIQMALRCMNPQVIVCDELGTQADLQAVEAGLACGVVFVASVHCDTLEALNRKPPTARLLAMGAFETLVLLDGRVNPGHAVKVRTLA